jgi:hypothetical protein
VAAAAKRMGLPPYVFGLAHAEWLVWRGGNEAWLGYPLTLGPWRLDEVRARLAARGAPLEEVASFPETLWENRPEPYWRRSPRRPPFLPAALAEGPPYAPARLFRIARSSDTMR